MHDNGGCSFSVIDAGVRTPVCVLSETAVQFGDFDECLKLSAPFDTQFCLLDVSPTKENSSFVSYLAHHLLL